MPSVATDAELAAWVMNYYQHNPPHWGFDFLAISPGGRITDFFLETTDIPGGSDEAVEQVIANEATSSNAISSLGLVFIFHRKSGPLELTDLDKRHFTRFLIAAGYYSTPRAMFLKVGTTIKLITGKDLL
ncbi:MAG: hypothetical protein JWO15_3926 [Sphingomonadales bacterium]|nr:hypothetical protein [Sphingomonadales bacterium]